jgi:hypothetical protein
MATEKQPIPESKVPDSPVGIGQAWDNLVKADLVETYRNMKIEDLKKLKEKIERGEEPEEDLKEIVDYLKAVNNS